MVPVAMFRAVAVAVVVVVAMVGVVRRAAPVAQSPAEHDQAHAHHEQRGHQIQPRVEPLGDDVLESARVTSPSVKTPTVCVTVTMRPSKTAWRGVPRVPTR